MTGPGHAVGRTITVVGETPKEPAAERRKYRKIRETFSIEEARRAMGIDWMPMSDLSQAIPPPYTEFVGRQILEALR